MPKRKNKNPETIDELLVELESANDIVQEEVKEAVKEELPKTPPDNSDNKRDQLLKLAEDGDIDKSIVYIKKASKKMIDKLYLEYERKRIQKANEFLTDLLISKFASTLGGLDAIEKPESLTNELKKDKLLKRDVYSLVESISPYIPFIGIVSGGITTARHIYMSIKQVNRKKIEKEVPKMKFSYKIEQSKHRSKVVLSIL